jgi:CHAD domain-containing protein
MTLPATVEPDRGIVRVRFAQALARQSSLEGGGDEALHAFRLACKRLRFALERIEGSEFDAALDVLERISDDLGDAHDCSRLMRLAAECGTPLVCARAQRDRDGAITRARRNWRRAFADDGAFAALAAYGGFSW